ncbi:MAG: hypothetical protein JWM74_5054 [Myxococcaceae bacterium]|nr:hypothetical protein [Myxococcaceae bacterium]
MRPLLAVSFIAATLLGTVGAGAREPSVRIREVTQNADVQLDAATVRTALTSELAGVARNVHGSKRANLSMRVTRAVAVDGHIEYVVSAVVQDARGGNVLGMLEGRAQTTKAATSSDALERTMLKDAAHVALVNLPGVLR